VRRLIFCLFVLIAISFATVTVDGYAYLEDQSDHSGINVIFKSRYTDTVSDSVTTEENGYFTIRVKTNNYFITYEKDGYFSEDIKPRGTIELDANTTLSSVTLIKWTKLIKFADFIENKVVANFRKLNFPQKLLEKRLLADTTSQTPPARRHHPDTSQPPASEPAIRFSKNTDPPETTGEAGTSDQPPASNLATRFSKNTVPPETTDEAGTSDQLPASNLATRFSKNVVVSGMIGKEEVSGQPDTSQSPSLYWWAANFGRSSFFSVAKEQIKKYKAAKDLLGQNDPLQKEIDQRILELENLKDSSDVNSVTFQSVIRFSKNTPSPEMTSEAGSSDQPPASNLATRFSKNAVSTGAPGKTAEDTQQTITTKYRSLRKPIAKTKMDAMMRSLLFPGLGQFYANQKLWGYGWLAAEIIAGGLIVMNYSNYKTAYDDYNDYHTSYDNATDPVLIAHYKTQSQNSHNNIESARDGMINMAGIAGVVWITNAVHAYVTAPYIAYNEIPLQLAYDQNTDQFKLSVSIPLD